MNVRLLGSLIRRCSPAVRTSSFSMCSCSQSIVSRRRARFYRRMAEKMNDFSSLYAPCVAKRKSGSLVRRIFLKVNASIPTFRSVSLVKQSEVLSRGEASIKDAMRKGCLDQVEALVSDKKGNVSSALSETQTDRGKFNSDGLRLDPYPSATVKAKLVKLRREIQWIWLFSIVSDEEIFVVRVDVQTPRRILELIVGVDRSITCIGWPTKDNMTRNRPKLFVDPPTTVRPTLALLNHSWMCWFGVFSNMEVVFDVCR